MIYIYHYCNNDVLLSSLYIIVHKAYIVCNAYTHRDLHTNPAYKSCIYAVRRRHGLVPMGSPSLSLTSGVTVP